MTRPCDLGGAPVLGLGNLRGTTSGTTSGSVAFTAARVPADASVCAVVVDAVSIVAA
jgi:hypothetical protein